MAKIFTFLAISTLFISGCFKPVDLGHGRFIGATVEDTFTIDINKDQFRLQLGKLGETILSGTLQPFNKNKSYNFQLKNNQAVVAMIPNQLLIYGTKNGLGVGISNHAKSNRVDEVAGVYNFVVQYQSNDRPKYSYGTFELLPDFTWRSWSMKNGSENKEGHKVSGNWLVGGNGIIKAMLDKENVFANIASLGENYGNGIVIDLVAKQGIALGTKQALIRAGSIDGEYSVLSSLKPEIKKASVRDVVAMNGKNYYALGYNEPWNGFVKDRRSEFIGTISANGNYFFGLNIGAISGNQYVFAAIKDS